MSFLASLRVALVAVAALVPASAQQQQIQVFGGNAPRMAATKFLFGPAGLATICVQYGQPPWKAEYDTMLTTMKGKNIRLGKDFWTTMNSSAAMTIGGTKVPAGSYYLGLKNDAEGKLHLAVLDAVATNKAGVGPGSIDQWKIDFACPLEMKAGDKQVDALTIDLAHDAAAPTKMTLSIAWGKHVLSAPVEVQYGAATK
jgi:hypothetical protein